MIVWHLDGQEEFYFESLYEKAFDDNYHARPSDSRFVSVAPHALYCFYCCFIFFTDYLLTYVSYILFRKYIFAQKPEYPSNLTVEKSKKSSGKKQKVLICVDS